MSWGSTIVPVDIDGITYQMYEQRPKRLGSLLELGSRWGARPHIVQGERIVTFDQLGDLVRRRADALRAAGVGPGDRVVVLGFNSPEWIANFWATVVVGGVAVLANAWWSQSELDEALDLVEPTVVIPHERLRGRVPTKWTVLPWNIDESEAAHTEVAMSGLDSQADENHPAAIIFTSGTSGKPKAVVLSHRSLVSGLQMLLHITKRFPEQVDERSGEAALHTGPMFHVGGVQTLLRAVILGDTLVMPAGKFDPGEVMGLIEKWKIRRWSAVPTMVTRVLEHPDVRTRDLTTIKALTVGGAPVTSELLQRIRTGFPGVEPRIATGYGLTENGGQAAAASGKDTIERPGTTGRALPCVEVKIGPSTEFADGEILLRSPTQMLGYLGTAESPIDGEGWLSTGDLGRLDHDGYLWITGRSKDMIIRGGENIAPAAVEEVLMRLSAIKDAVVFGMPNPDLGEEVVASVVLADDANPLAPEALAAGLKGAIASFAIPTRWMQHIGPFPLNHSGKVDKIAVVANARKSVGPS